MLSTGGTRGIAYIGVIEELERQGFEITSLAGCSMGTLVGAAYISGNLPACKEWFCGLDKCKMLGLADFTFGRKGLFKGKRIIKKIEEIIPDLNIEDLPIPYTAVATDMASGREIVFSKGSLREAICASISLPMIFEPFEKEGMMLADGGIINPLPLDCVKRTDGDLLVAVVTSMPDSNRKQIKLGKFTLLTESITLMIRRIAQFSIEQHQPDIVIQVPSGGYGILQLYKSSEIIKIGTCATREALEKYGNIKDQDND